MNERLCFRAQSQHGPSLPAWTVISRYPTVLRVGSSSVIAFNGRSGEVMAAGTLAERVNVKRRLSALSLRSLLDKPSRKQQEVEHVKC